MRRSFITGGPLVLLCLWGCGGSDADAEATATISIGAVLDQTGGVAAPSWSESVQLAVAHVNAGLETADVNLRVSAILADSAGDKEVTPVRATTLVHDQGAVGVITDLSSASINTNKLNYDPDESKHLDVPGICILCTSTQINNPNVVKTSDEDPEGAAVEQAALRDAEHWWYRTSTNQDYIVNTMMRTLITAGPNGDGDVNGDGCLRVGLYVNQDNPGNDFRALLGGYLEDNPSVPAELETLFLDGEIDLDTHDWDLDLTMLVDDRNDDVVMNECGDGARVPDVILESVLASGSTAVVKRYAARDVDVPFFHFHGFRHPLSTQNLGDAMNGHEGVAHVVIDNGASGDVFADALLAATGVGPQYLDSSAYDAAVVLSLAAIAASRDLDDPGAVTGAQVRDAMSMLETGSEIVRTGGSEMAKAIASLRAGTAINYEGASGPVDFGESGNALGKLAHYIGVNGVWEERELYDCTRPDCPLVE